MSFELPKVIRDFVTYQDGVSMAGRCIEATIPDTEFVAEEHLAGGMAAPLDMWLGHVAKMESELTLAGLSSDFTKQLGRPNGMMTHRGAISNGGETLAAVFVMRGFFKKSSIGSLKNKEKGETKIMGSLHYFKATIGGVEITEIDVFNKVCKIHGEDLLAADRAALGI